MEQSNEGQPGRRTFAGADLLQIAMPMGGIGAGCICLNGHGGLQDFSIRHRPSTTALPDGHGVSDAGFALVRIAGETPVTRLVEGPIPVEKVYDQGLQGQGFRRGGFEGLPRFESAVFEAGYPFGQVTLEDPRLPLKATVTGWSPFIPNDDINSGLPCAILEYTFENISSAPVSLEFSYHLSHLAVPGGRWEEARSAVMPPQADGMGGGVSFTDTLPGFRDEHGSAALYLLGGRPQVKASWFRGGWFDALSVLWREVSEGRFQPNDGAGSEGQGGRTGGSVLVAQTLAPGESVTYPIVIAWHFPNSSMTLGRIATEADCGPDCDCSVPVQSPAWHPFYTSQWADAQAVAQHVAKEYDALRARTQAFAEALFSSTLPGDVLDAVAANLAILKSPTVLRQKNGNVWGWEGCFTQGGCCHGTCTHVWNYAQALPHLFPALERTLREQELERSMDERGHVQFRAALPDGAPPHDHYAAADGQLGGLLKLYRDYQISGDREWLARLYPRAKQSLDYCIATWDPDRRGLPFEPHHNTYDIEFWGPDGMCGTLYIAALAAFASLARTLGHSEDAAPYEKLAARGAALMDEMLFNGDYYEQHVMWEGLRDTSVQDRIAGAAPNDEAARLLRTEGPKYQYGTGCLSDGVIGAWMAQIYGIPTPINRENVRRTLRAIFDHNFRADLWEHACVQRPGYAIGHEAGLRLCTWPRGGKLTLPFPYSDEVWTGIEYQVASHLMEEGMAAEGLAIVSAVRARYDGHIRNPFNEYECGNYYARAMSSYALLGSLSGFRYSAADRTLWFGPKIAADPFRTFFSTASGFGTITLQGKSLTVEMIEGELPIERLHLTRDGETQEIACGVTATVGQSATLSLA